LDMVQYTKRVRTDLSTIYDAHQFCREMERIAQEMLRVLRPGGFCGLLIGDVRRKGRFVPLGFLVMSVFIRSGFGLLEVNVKEQHKTAMAEFWKRKDTFTRLEHEYLFVFQKPQVQHLAVPTDPDTAAQNGKNNGYDPFVGVVECLKGYGRVVFGQDGFCPVAGYSVYTTPCSRCSVPSKWPTPPLVSETTVETAKPEPKARKAPRAKRPALRVRGKN
ncbi:MAG TPA: hypothetical protein VFD84_08990, partial [Candidatus Binatia bacterium]|nr:hypothetical protein [Candidatus Binatia bacterium]